MRSVFFWLVLVTCLVACQSESAKIEARTAEFPTFGEAPQFTLTDTSGAPFQFEANEGKVRLVSFFFARCPSICPRINEQLSQIFESVKSNPDVLFVSISVDPEHDSPEVLAEYAVKYRKESKNWKFLTGDKTLIQELLSDGFKLSSGMLPDEHNTRIVIVDRKGSIRGFYQGMDKEHMARLEADFQRFFPS